MPINPKVSFITEDAVQDTSFYKTLVIVGQSNTAGEGLYKDIELKSEKEINSIFGASSHIASLLRDNKTMLSNSIIKPKIWAISYEDLSGGVARILESVVAGTATESKTMNIKINSMNPDRLMTQAATVLALRNTKGAYCGAYGRNSVEFGAPSNINMPFNPILADAFDNDVIVEVEITSGMTSTQAAAAINAAINAKTTSIYGSSVVSSTLTITSKHKGSVSNFFTFEVVPSSIAAGLSVTTTVDTAGTGTVVSTGILDIEDQDGMKLSELDFNYIVIPYGYSVSALNLDAKAKWDNVLNYNNRCLEYNIFRATALDMSSLTALNSLASAEPISEANLPKSMFILRFGTDTLTIKGISDFSQREAIEAKQFTPIQRELNGQISVGNTYSLSDSIGFIDLQRLLNAGLFREVIVEKFIPSDFVERNFTDGKSVNAYTYNKDNIIAKFQLYRDICDGSNVNSVYGTDYAGIVDNNAAARARFDELLSASIVFDKITKQLILKLISDLTNPIKSIFIISYYQ